MSYTYDYERPMVTTDCIVVNTLNEVLLIKRKNSPFEGKWALPGGFIEMDEDLMESAKRELKEETSVDAANIVQFKTYGKPGRDPRGRTITIVYYCFVEENIAPRAGDDAAQADWFHLQSLPPMAFDHADIINDFLLFCKIEKGKK